MAEATKPSSSFLSSISPWSRSNTPPPKSPRQGPKDDSHQLKQSTGVDHTISLRPSPSLRRYPRDCPPLITKWYYAVDVAKRKPFATESGADEPAKAAAGPKKFVPFSATDSQAIEKAYQSLDRGDKLQSDTSDPTSTRVPVNEDFLFDVHIEKRELEPAYWLGPVYEVRRGSWFHVEGSFLRACDENLANQLEEGYLKLAPWRRLGISSPRSTSQPRSRPASLIVDGASALLPNKANPAQDDSQTAASHTYRLFGTHMNTTVTYQDAVTAFLSSDDFYSRMSSITYGRFVGYGGTKVVRGWSESTRLVEPKPTDPVGSKEKRKSAKITIEPLQSSDPTKSEQELAEQEPESKPRRSALERQLSSLAGMPASQEGDISAEEEAREQEEKEMEDAREKDGDDQARQIDHLVLVTHGIGQRLGLRLDSINFVHDVNTLRKTMKAVYGSAPDLQALSGDPKNCRVQVLPVAWRHLLDFPKQSLKQNRKEFDLGDADDDLDDVYPSLQDITVEGVPAVRNLITDLAMDVLLYQSAYREHIAWIVQQECNRVYQLFKQRTGFSGQVSLCGHSLGSAVLFDILCRQEEVMPTRPRRVSSKTTREPSMEQTNLKLDFDVQSFFCLGSPIALFQMLKGRTVSGRHSLSNHHYGGGPIPTSPFDPDPMTNDPFDIASSRTTPISATKELIPITTSSPKCGELFNIFHPTDPIAYRIEPLISPAMAQLKSQPLPYTKKGLFAAPGIANISARVGQQVMSSWYNLTSGVASSLINRSLGITGEEQALPQDKGKSSQLTGPGSTPVGGPNIPQIAMPTADKSRQQALAEAARSSPTSEQPPTLIDSEIETLYSGFQKRRRSHTPASPARTTTATGDPASTSAATDPNQTSTTPPAEPEADPADYMLSQDRARKLKREEAKVRALNSNGRVDYHIQEGMFDVSLLASIASHLSYWADEDVNHFMIGQMLKKTSKGRGQGGGGNGNEEQKAREGGGADVSEVVNRKE